MNGILLIVMNQPYYARMAVNFVRSIRSYDRETLIQLITNCEQFFPDEEKLLFNIITPTKEENPFYVKTKIYELSAFDNTIYLDSDMIALNQKHFKELFDKEDVLSFACRGSTEYKDIVIETSQWANLPKVLEYYNIKTGRWLQLSSEFIRFKKTKEVESFFHTASLVYSELKLYSDLFTGVKRGLENGIGGFVPDELAFGISCMMTNIYPSDKYTPIYWTHAEKRHIRSVDPYVNENYYGYSMGGAHASQNQKDFYNMMMQHHMKRLGLKPVFFKAQNKSRYVKGREVI